MPWERRIDVRFTKGFRWATRQVRAFADWRNPFNLSNTNQIYLETGDVENDLFRTGAIDQQLSDAALDGDADIDDFNIELEGPDNEFNKFSLIRAEQRFGDGDGIFTVEEQRAAAGAWFDLIRGPQWFRESNQRLRLGIEILF